MDNKTSKELYYNKVQLIREKNKYLIKIYTQPNSLLKTAANIDVISFLTTIKGQLFLMGFKVTKTVKKDTSFVAEIQNKGYSRKGGINDEKITQKLLTKIQLDVLCKLLANNGYSHITDKILNNEDLYNNNFKTISIML